MVVDYHSKLIEVANIPKPVDAPSVVHAMEKIFSRHGIPQIVFSDKGPQYTAASFKRFADKWDFQHDFSSPHFPQSNGLVERSIQTVKRSMKKAHETQNDPFLSLLVLNTTPSNDGSSPAYKMYHRNPRTTLPAAIVQTPHAIAPNPKAKETYDQHARDLTKH